jgi:predicted nucleic acid-binding protein
VFADEGKRGSVLTDTTFWIDLLEERRENRPGGASAFIARHRKHELYVSVVTWGEPAEGFEGYRGLETLLWGIRVLMLPQHIAWESSRIQRELAATGGWLGENDSWIAATARAWGQRLVTRDDAFQRVPRLRLARY